MLPTLNKALHGGRRSSKNYQQLNNKTPLISVITVVFNCKNDVETTLKSVVNQKYKSFEYIVIDGGSTDGTVNYISDNENLIDYWQSEPDKGIYHAMNKAVQLATGKYLLFMNAGDIFDNENTLSELEPLLHDDVDVLFSDWKYFGSSDVIIANKPKLNVRHQSIVYKKQLHEIYGNYLVGNNVTISDYIFFLSIEHLNWKYYPKPISVCDKNGVSGNVSHFYQRIYSEAIFNKASKLKLTSIILLYPFYRVCKRLILKIKKK